MSKYFPKPKSLEANVKVELDLSNYATKADLKNAAGFNTSDFAKKTDLANLKSDVDKLDIDKLRNVQSNLGNLKSKVDKLDIDKLVRVPVDVSKLSDVVKTILLKRLNIMNQLKKLLILKLLILMIQLKKLNMIQKLMKLEINLLLITIMRNILLFKNLIN